MAAIHCILTCRRGQDNLLKFQLGLQKGDLSAWFGTFEQMGYSRSQSSGDLWDQFLWYVEPALCYRPLNCTIDPVRTNESVTTAVELPRKLQQVVEMEIQKHQ